MLSCSVGSRNAGCAGTTPFQNRAIPASRAARPAAAPRRSRLHMEVSATAARSSARPSPAPPSAGHNSQASSAGDGSSSSGTVPPVDPLADPLHLPLVSVPAVKPGGEAAQLPLPEPFAGQAWAEGLARVSGQVLGLVRAHVDPGLAPAPTTYAPEDGLLREESLDGGKSAAVAISTWAGPVVAHGYVAQSVFPVYGRLHTKIGVQAGMAQGTPYLELSLSGTRQEALLMLLLTPRLSPLVHPAYVARYWRSTPPGAPAGLLSFTQLEERARHSVLPYAPPCMWQQLAGPSAPNGAAVQAGLNAAAAAVREAVAAQTSSRDAASSSHNSNGNGDGAPAPGAGPAAAQGSAEAAGATTTGAQPHPPPPPLVYQRAWSPSMFTRMTMGSGLLLTFDPCDPAALAVVERDVGDFVRLWAAWAAFDTAAASAGGAGVGSGLLQGEDAVRECKAASAAAARYLQQDEDTARAEKIFGAKAVARMGCTLSGEASLVGKPWWLD